MKIDEASIQKCLQDLEVDANKVETMINDIANRYTSGLDRYIKFVAGVLKDGDHPATDQELEDFCLNISTQIYFVSSSCEQMGVRDDISRAAYKEMYNSKRKEIPGTIADKDAYAELESQKEQLVNIIYSRVYKIIKAKIDNAQEILNSAKKVLNRRTEELGISKLVK